RAARNHVTPAWAVTPGQAMCFASDTDLRALTRKLDAMWALGFRAFQLQFQDVSYTEWHCGEEADRFGTVPAAAARVLARVAHGEGGREWGARLQGDTAALTGRQLHRVALRGGLRPVRPQTGGGGAGAGARGERGGPAPGGPSPRCRGPVVDADRVLRGRLDRLPACAGHGAHGGRGGGLDRGGRSAADHHRRRTGRGEGRVRASAGDDGHLSGQRLRARPDLPRPLPGP